MNTDMSPHRTCGTCKHKGQNITVPDEDFNRKPTRFFLCELINHSEGRSGHPGTDAGFSDEEDAKKAEGSGAFVVDGSGYYAALCVEEDFGCNKWELRPGLIGMRA